MKSKIVTALVIVAALAIGFFLGRFHTGRQWNRFFMEFVYTDTSNDAFSTIRTLIELRAGRQTNAVDILENTLDSDLITYISFEELRPQERSKAGLDVIRAARDYRTKHPWQSESAEVNDGVQRVLALAK